MSTDFTDHHPIVVANDNRGGTAFIIESGDVAAGIIVREGRSYRFFSAGREFRALDGEAYATPRAAQKAVDVLRVELERRATDVRPGRWAVLTL